MRNIFTLCLAIVYTIATNAQTTITRSDFGNIGDKIYYAYDTTLTAGFSVGAAGANIAWDFSASVSPNYHDSSTFEDPTTIQDSPEESNLAIVEGGSPNYFNISDSSVRVIIPTDFLGGGSNTQILVTTLPFTYGASPLVDSTSSMIQGTPDDFGLSGTPFDSIRININIHTMSTIDGWGTIKTPESTYDALRVKNDTKVGVAVQGKLQFVGTWIDVPYDAGNNNEKTYGWYTNGKKYTIAQADLDSNDNITSFRYQVSEVPLNTGLESLSKNITTSLQPNPATDELKILFKSNYTEKGILKVFDITGKLLISESINITQNQNEIAVKTIDLNNGIYFTQIVSEHINTTSKFVVKH